MTLPEGQRVRREWPRAFAELVLVFQTERERVRAAELERKARG